MQELRIIGLLITDRIKEAGLTQKTLTQHAHVIKSRLDSMKSMKKSAAVSALCYCS